MEMTFGNRRLPENSQRKMFLEIILCRTGHTTQALFGGYSLKMPHLGTCVLTTPVPSALVGSSQSDFIKIAKMASLANACRTHAKYQALHSHLSAV